MKKLTGKSSAKGSSIVEAAVIIPVLFIITALIINVITGTVDNVGNRCIELESDADDMYEQEALCPEGIFRMRFSGGLTDGDRK